MLAVECMHWSSLQHESLHFGVLKADSFPCSRAVCCCLMHVWLLEGISALSQSRTGALNDGVVLGISVGRESCLMLMLTRGFILRRAVSLQHFTSVRPPRIRLLISYEALERAATFWQRF